MSIEFLQQLFLSMKSLHHSFDIDSHSTQEKERRFSRCSPSKSPKQPSVRSSQSPLPKFYIKNLKTSITSQSLQSYLTTEIHAPKDTSSFMSQAQRTFVQSQKVLVQLPNNKNQGEQKRSRVVTPKKGNRKNEKMSDIVKMEQEIRKYEEYARKINEKCKGFELGLKKVQADRARLQELCNQYQVKVEGLEGQVRDLQTKIAQKDVLIDMLQKEKSTLSKVKTTIHQARTIELEKQKQSLTLRVKQLQNQLHQQVQSSTYSVGPCPILCKTEYTLDQMYQRYHRSQEEVRKLQVEKQCLQRRYFKELEQMQDKYEKDSNAIKSKYMEVLTKYRMQMKNVTGEKLRKLKEKGNMCEEDAICEASMESLELSDDQ